VAENPQNQNDIWMLVHGCEFRTKKEQAKWDTCLLEQWELSYSDRWRELPQGRSKTHDGMPVTEANKEYMAPNLNWVRPENVVARYLVIEEEPGVFEVAPKHPSTNRHKKRVTMVKAREFWQDDFC
jgi:hypothetical protein